jgi:hypothetical protein
MIGGFSIDTCNFDREDINLNEQICQSKELYEDCLLEAKAYLTLLEKSTLSRS